MTDEPNIVEAMTDLAVRLFTVTRERDIAADEYETIAKKIPEYIAYCEVDDKYNVLVQEAMLFHNGAQLPTIDEQYESLAQVVEQLGPDFDEMCREAKDKLDQHVANLADQKAYMEKLEDEFEQVMLNAAVSDDPLDGEAIDITEPQNSELN